MKKKQRRSSNQSPVNSMGNEFVAHAVSTLEKGGVVAYPTETYYGLGVDITNENAVRRLYEIKERERDKPILVLINSVEQLLELTPSIPVEYTPLIENHWPGALTLIFPALDSISPLVTGNTGTIGVRISSNPIAQKICAAWGKPLPATSANISGSEPACTVDDVKRHFKDSIDYIVPSQGTPGGKGSTIVSMGSGGIVVLRKGPVTEEQLFGM